MLSPLAGLQLFCNYTALVWGFFTSPDYKQLETVKIIFIHVPAAFLAINIYLMMTIASLIWLIRRHYVSAFAAKSSAMIGLTMTIITIITEVCGVAAPGNLLGLGSSTNIICDSVVFT